jgi:hypothetical protein
MIYLFNSLIFILMENKSRRRKYNEVVLEELKAEPEGRKIKPDTTDIPCDKLRMMSYLHSLT